MSLVISFIKLTDINNVNEISFCVKWHAQESSFTCSFTPPLGCCYSPPPNTSKHSFIRFMKYGGICNFRDRELHTYIHGNEHTYICIHNYKQILVVYRPQSRLM